MSAQTASLSGYTFQDDLVDDGLGKVREGRVVLSRLVFRGGTVAT